MRAARQYGRVLQYARLGPLTRAFLSFPAPSGRNLHDSMRRAFVALQTYIDADEILVLVFPQCIPRRRGTSTKLPGVIPGSPDFNAA